MVALPVLDRLSYDAVQALHGSLARRLMWAGGEDAHTHTTDDLCRQIERVDAELDCRWYSSSTDDIPDAVWDVDGSGLTGFVSNRTNRAY